MLVQQIAPGAGRLTTMEGDLVQDAASETILAVLVSESN